MRIALILTGGTICSRVTHDGTRRSDVGTASTLLEQHYRLAHPYSSVQFEVQMPLNCLSEDMTPDDWCVILRSIAALDLRRYDGIIIAHGTDTLDQTAGMLSAALSGISIPVILVSAIEPPDDPQTNGHANFEAAVKLICKRLYGGVWVVYENSDGEMYLHRGFELLPCRNESRSFYSRSMHKLSAVFDAAPVRKKSACLDMQTLAAQGNAVPDILLIRPYTGLRYDTMNLDGVTAVVHGSYHSETANSVRFSPYAFQTLIQRCRERGISCYFAPCSERNQSYGSAYDLIQEGAIPIADVTLSFAYGAVWTGCLLGFRGEQLTSYVRQLRQSLESQFFLCCI